MKNNLIISFFCVTIFSIGLMSSSNGVAEAQNQDRTGAPGSSESCVLCHAPSSITASTSISVFNTNGEEITAYIPGENYEVNFIVSGNGAAGFGFQATSILTDGSNAGEFSNPGDAVQLESVGDRHIVEHSTTNTTGIFTTTWIAPEVGSGDVGFFMSGLAANLQNQNWGDGHHETALALTESSIIGIDDIVIMAQPVATSNGIILNPKVDGTIAIFDISGRQNFIREVFSNETINVEISQISRGLQIIHFTPQNQSNETFAPQTWKVVIPS
ncbi:MAG: hypothetical protein CL831_08410 [Crocinitomicaceae bacterium]|nr:hypothetical protein [Crocinitomicaceae bacterium]